MLLILFGCFDHVMSHCNEVAVVIRLHFDFKSLGFLNSLGFLQITKTSKQKCINDAFYFYLYFHDCGEGYTGC